jgi:SPP1 gp7 family putative phage head morphogenesis protein
MADKIDPAHAETEEILKKLENRIKKEYQVATKEMEAKIDDYMERFELKDQKWQEWVADGTKTDAQYKMWRQQQMMVGKSYEALKDTLADEMVNADKIAKAMTLNTMPDVYATNFNYGTFEAEKGAKLDTSFTLYDRNTVNRLLKEDPDFIPPMGRQAKKDVAEGKVKAWNKQQVQSVMTQGILQGESIPQLSKRLATTVGERNYKSAIRNARTMTTGVQNAGRMDSYRRAESLGIDMEVEWRATLDNRTRHEHRQLDGQRQPVGEPFEVHGIKIEYAGDPHAPAHMIYNCRCTLRGIVSGLEPRARKYRDDSMIDGMSYNEWKAQKKSKSNPITLQEEKGKAIAEKYRKEYRRK